MMNMLFVELITYMSKIKYKDKIAAMFALSQCKRSPKGKRRECRVYCHEGAWYLTSKKYE